MQQNVGIAYLHNHFHIESWELMFSRIPLLKDMGVKILYLEWPKATLGPLFSHFNKTGDVGVLQQHLNLFLSFIPQQVPYVVKLCAVAHANGQTVIPIDSSSFPGMEDQMIEDMQYKNNLRDNYMQFQIAKHQLETAADKKFAVLLGINHFNVARNLNIQTIGLFPGPETKKTLAPPTELQAVLWSMQRHQNTADINFTLSTSSNPKSICNTQLKRLGFFASAGIIAAVAVGVALSTLVAP